MPLTGLWWEGEDLSLASWNSGHPDQPQWPEMDEDARWMGKGGRDEKAEGRDGGCRTLS